jgi:heme-degrading monooxygenase HmoA
MSHALLLRVTPVDFDSWLTAHQAAGPARRTFGITDGPLYRDVADPTVALVHLNVEDVERAIAWFSSDAFRAASNGVKVRQRQLWVADERK